MGSNLSTPQRNPEERHLETLHVAVFENDLLLERILVHALRKSNTSEWDDPLCNTTAQVLRQVSRSWLITTSTIFQKSKCPLFRFSLGTVDKEQGYGIEPELHDLSTSVAFGRLYWENVTNPFRLSLELAPFYHGAPIEDQARLVKTLQYLDPAALTELWIQEPCEAVRPLPDLGLMNFPLLRFMFLMYSRQNGGESDLEEESAIRFDHFFQTILDGARNLEHMEVAREYLAGHRRLPVPLSPSLTHLETVYHPEMNVLPARQVQFDHLRYLDLDICEGDDLIGSKGESFRRLLERCSGTLKTLKLIAWWLPELQLDLASFPVLPKLEELTLNVPSFIWRPSEEGVACSSRFPALKVLEFYTENGSLSHFADAMCSKNSLFPSLWGLKLSVSAHKDSWYVFPVNAFRQISSSFGNLSELSLILCWANSNVIRKVFGTMQQLRKLEIQFDFGMDSVSSDACDALIIGTTPQMSSHLRANASLRPRFLEDVAVAEQQGRQMEDEEVGPSIRNMSHLQTFSICGYLSPSGVDRWEDWVTGLLTEVAFFLGFNMAPSLRHMKATGSFAVIDHQMLAKIQESVNFNLEMEI